MPHQANKRIIDGVARKLGISPEQVVLTLDRHGNTSAASIPLALNDAVADRRIKRGDLVMLEAMGGGLHLGGHPDPVVGAVGAHCSGLSPLTFACTKRISFDKTEGYVNRR